MSKLHENDPLTRSHQSHQDFLKKIGITHRLHDDLQMSTLLPENVRLRGMIGTTVVSSSTLYAKGRSS